jgi:hypothetical protein
MKKEDRAKINDARVRNMLEKLPEIRRQLAGYYDDLRKIEHEVYEFNQKFALAIRSIDAVERFYPGEEKAIEEKPERKIIPFPARNAIERKQEPPKAPEQRKVSLEEHCEGFKGVQFGAYYHTRIIYALYDLHIHSLEELVKTPPDELSKHRGIGAKTFEIIRSVLESNGIASELWGLPEAAATRKEN